MTSRKSHVVRVFENDDDTSETYVDVEVLDAISFITENGKEMVLSFKKASPFIKDNTGGGHGKSPGSPTRASHMERIKTGDGSTYMDVEVLDCVAFSDQNGEEWILNLPSSKSSKFNKTEGGSGSASTRTHNEKVKLKDSTADFTTVERTDMVAFRTINGKELIVKMASNDDGGTRAETTVSPAGYDPSKDSPKPPKNTDPNIYVSIPSGSTPITGATKVSQGMLWWIRKISAGGGIAYFTFVWGATKEKVQPVVPTVTLKNLPWDGEFDVRGDIKSPTSSPVTIVNPISGEMRADLNQWTPAPEYTTQGDSNIDGSILYFVSNGPAITKENAYIPYPGTDQCGTPVTVAGAWGGTFFRCNTQVQNEAASHGFNQIGILTQGQWSNLADAEYTAAALNSLKFFEHSTVSVYAVAIGDPTSLHKKSGASVFAINIGKAAALRQDPDSDVFTFDVEVSASPDGQFVLSGAAYKTLKDFPISAKNVPLFEDFPQAIGGGAPTTGPTTIHVTVNVKDFTVEMEVNGGGAPAEG